MDNNLPDGHVSVQEAIDALEKHTAKKPIVDLEFMHNNIPYMNAAKNFTMPLMQKGDNGRYYSAMHVAVVVKTARDLENLKYAIKEAHKRVTGKVADPEKKIKKFTSQVKGDEDNTSNLRVNTESDAKYGDKMKSGHATVGKKEK